MFLVLLFTATNLQNISHIRSYSPEKSTRFNGRLLPFIPKSAVYHTIRHKPLHNIPLMQGFLQLHRTFASSKGRNQLNDIEMKTMRFAALMAAMMMTMMSSAKTQDWGGRVIDEKGEPMPFVNVVLLSLPDSAFVQGAMTDEQGVFKIVTDISDGLFKVC